MGKSMERRKRSNRPLDCGQKKKHPMQCVGEPALFERLDANQRQQQQQLPKAKATRHAGRLQNPPLFLPASQSSTKQTNNTCQRTARSGARFSRCAIGSGGNRRPCALLRASALALVAACAVLARVALASLQQQAANLTQRAGARELSLAQAAQLHYPYYSAADEQDNEHMDGPDESGQQAASVFAAAAVPLQTPGASQRHGGEQTSGTAAKRRQEAHNNHGDADDGQLTGGGLASSPSSLIVNGADERLFEDNENENENNNNWTSAQQKASRPGAIMSLRARAKKVNRVGDSAAAQVHSNSNSDAADYDDSATGFEVNNGDQQREPPTVDKRPARTFRLPLDTAMVSAEENNHGGRAGSVHHSELSSAADEEDLNELKASDESALLRTKQQQQQRQRQRQQSAASSAAAAATATDWPRAAQPKRALAKAPAKPVSQATKFSTLLSSSAATTTTLRPIGPTRLPAQLDNQAQRGDSVQKQNGTAEAAGQPRASLHKARRFVSALAPAVSGNAPGSTTRPPQQTNATGATQSPNNRPSVATGEALDRRRAAWFASVDQRRPPTSEQRTNFSPQLRSTSGTSNKQEEANDNNKERKLDSGLARAEPSRVERRDLARHQQQAVGPQQVKAAGQFVPIGPANGQLQRAAATVPNASATVATLNSVLEQLAASSRRTTATSHSGGSNRSSEPGASGEPGAARMSAIVRTGFIVPHPGGAHSIVTSGGAHTLRAIVPAAVALLAQAQNSEALKHSRAIGQLRALLASHQQHLQQLPPGGAAHAPSNATHGTGDQLLLGGSSSQLGGVAPARAPLLYQGGLAASESAGYGSIASLQDQTAGFASASPDERSSAGNGQQAGGGGGGGDPMLDGSADVGQQSSIGGGATGGQSGQQMEPSVGAGAQDQRVAAPYNSAQASDAYQQQQQQLEQYYGLSPFGALANGSNEQLVATFGSGVARSSDQQTGRHSLDPFEEFASAGGLATSDYERDLADLDEEFNRHVGFRARPQQHHVAAQQLMSDSMLALAPPERYESQAVAAAQRAPHSGYQRRPSFGLDYSPASADYLSAAAGSTFANVLPRTLSGGGGANYARHYEPQAGAPDSLWASSGALESYDFSPLASLLSPSQYSYSRWRAPTRHYAPGVGQARLAASPYALASSDQPTGFSLIPAGSFAQTPAAMPTETVSFTLSPLAAAAAAAATALAAADKSRHHHHHSHHPHHAWTFTLPRLASTLAAAGSLQQAAQPAAQASAQQQQQASGAQTAASSPHASTAASIPAYHAAAAAAAAAAYHQQHRQPVGSYLFGPMPTLYAIAPARPGPLTSAASAATPSILPYFGPTGPLIAYQHRAAAGGAHAPLLTTAGFAYPIRLPYAAGGAPPISFAAHQGGARPPLLAAGSPTRTALSLGPLKSTAAAFYSDLQLAESQKPAPASKGANKQELAGGSESTSAKGLAAKSAAGLTAMARNLGKKMFGSASQIRPQHVAPPGSYSSGGAGGVGGGGGGAVPADNQQHLFGGTNLNASLLLT